MPPALRPRPRSPHPIARWAVLSWLCACLLLAPLGGVRHALSHLGSGPASAQHGLSLARLDVNSAGSARTPGPATAPDDAHTADPLGHCDLCHIWDLLDATLPASFPLIAGTAPRIAPAPSTPRGTTLAAGSWFQSRAPPAAT